MIFVLFRNNWDEEHKDANKDKGSYNGEHRQFFSRQRDFEDARLFILRLLTWQTINLFRHVITLNCQSLSVCISV